MLANVFSATSIGLKTVLVTVEVNISERGLPSFQIVGLPDKAVAESRERVLAALENSQQTVPDHRMIINLSPADTPKEGTIYDLPIAIGVLAANDSLPKEKLGSYFFAGELSLTGALTTIRGILPLILCAKQLGFTHACIPIGNADEVSIVNGICIYPARTLNDVVLHMCDTTLLKQLKVKSLTQFYKQITYEVDFADIIEQYMAKRAMEVAASGFHNVLLKGPPGTGKTLLAKALPSLLPPLTTDEVMETTKIYSVSGTLTARMPLILYPPFRSPHHTISRIGLTGGGSSPLPGEISLAHRGVLFLDEMAEFTRSSLEALRQPLEDGNITISRAKGTASYPARFMLIAAINPCPCGNLGNEDKRCVCTSTQILKYKKRLSGPILDRIDIHVFVPNISAQKLSSSIESESSINVQRRVLAAREMQKKRFIHEDIMTNGEMGTKHIKKYCQMSDEALTALRKAVDVFKLSARVYFKLIKVAQTVADLAQSPHIELSHMQEAIQFRVSE
ncbi:magnesium chelatase [Candidatus Roizmanbacteria bacterium CG10_big_fil_rev_8_21_14_0_10_39_6]|uniref:Magnesium chelatase n=1 Tax=Candidatus Roizmanbacteria bacterium CG10_big_fil_rev_8_21_14_0_10_39_6 TaxID=1974853 RepID=A0A2M8KRH9_9BACT|nr:MAG: magnesium chelatase [Candidatus Roizmanbacteria bacterium CG10_big_fil_rev_8_21_14_0_10_39_6]